MPRLTDLEYEKVRKMMEEAERRKGARYCKKCGRRLASMNRSQFCFNCQQRVVPKGNDITWEKRERWYEKGKWEKEEGKKD